MNSPARLVVWEPTTGEVIEGIDLPIQAIVEAEGGAEGVVLAIDRDEYGQDLTIRPEWVGKNIYMIVSPSFVTSDRMTAEIVSVAKDMGVPVA